MTQISSSVSDAISGSNAGVVTPDLLKAQMNALRTEIVQSLELTPQRYHDLFSQFGLAASNLDIVLPGASVELHDEFLELCRKVALSLAEGTEAMVPVQSGGFDALVGRIQVARKAAACRARNGVAELKELFGALRFLSDTLSGAAPSPA
jgi:hypothetical protein